MQKTAGASAALEPLEPPASTPADDGPRPGPVIGFGGHNPALDGLRAIAVLAVFFHHMDVLPGGYVGVDLFLVLSGFLITGLLLAERDRTGGISLKAFWVRRAFRLLPAFYVFVLVGIPLVLLLKDADDQWQFLRNGVAAVLYVANIYRAIEPHDTGAWFNHTWSLSLEEQFYLVWPLALVLLCRRPGLRQRTPEILAGVILLVLIWREVLIALGASNLRIYFGPDTRVDALLVGCLLAVWRHDALRAQGGPRHADRERRIRLMERIAQFGPLALLALVAVFLAAPKPDSPPTWLAYGGYTLVAILAAVAVLAADRHRPARYYQFLSTRIMSWTGRISYSLYLWHFPVTGIANDKLVPRIGRGPASGLALAASVALAAGSYYLIERPVQRRRPAWASSGSQRRQNAAGDGLVPEQSTADRPAVDQSAVDQPTVKLSVRSTAPSDAPAAAPTQPAQID